jgi:hypothetical protein
MSEQILDVPAVETPAAIETPAPVATPAQVEAPLLADPTPAPFEFPEAFRVVNGEAVDVTASAAKLAEAYQARAAYGEIPAADAEYNPVEGLAQPWEEIKSLEAVKGFAEEAKKLGMTHEQFAFSLKTISNAERDGRLMQIEEDRTANEAKLREVWKEPAVFDAQIKNARSGLNLLPEAERTEFMTRYGNDASIIKLLAKIGGEISEDAPIHTPTIVSGEDIKTLMHSDAYKDSKHPEHAAAMARVQKYYSENYTEDSAI